MWVIADIAGIADIDIIASIVSIVSIPAISAIPAIVKVKVKVRVIVFFVTLGYYIDVSGIFFPTAFAFSFQIFGISVCLY